VEEQVVQVFLPQQPPDSQDEQLPLLQHLHHFHDLQEGFEPQ
jgi:hypothetical protein